MRVVGTRECLSATAFTVSGGSLPLTGGRSEIRQQLLTTCSVRALSLPPAETPSCTLDVRSKAWFGSQHRIPCHGQRVRFMAWFTFLFSRRINALLLHSAASCVLRHGTAQGACARLYGCGQRITSRTAISCCVDSEQSTAERPILRGARQDTGVSRSLLFLDQEHEQNVRNS